MEISQNKGFIFASESFGEGNSDKLCDFICDSILDACLEIDSKA